VLRLDVLEVRSKIALHGLRQHRRSVAVSLAAPDDDLVPREVDVLRAETTAFEEP
jgi:hypothetical protein